MNKQIPSLLNLVREMNQGRITGRFQCLAGSVMMMLHKWESGRQREGERLGMNIIIHETNHT